MLRPLVLAVLLPLLVAPLAAQIGQGEVGLHLIKASGNAGIPCTREFQCSFDPTPLQRGERVAVEVRGVLGQPYAVLVGPVTRLCLSFPGFHNALMLPPTSAVPFAGVLNLPDSILACPGGLARARFAVPATVPPGTSVALQAIAFSFLPQGVTPTFTPSLVGTVR